MIVFRIFLTAFALFGVVAPSKVYATPKRVVSMNLCTDQLAILIAAPKQLYSVSQLATDPEGSVMYEEAQKFPLNHGLAEEVFMMQPDLVLAGTFTSRATVAMLKHLKFDVEEFPPSYSFPQIREQIARMGRLLGREERADALVKELDQQLADAIASHAKTNLLAALHYANSYTAGGGTLAGEVLKSAGLENLGERMGLSGTVKLPLEILVMMKPDMIIGGRRPGNAPALAYETFQHPALRAVLKNEDMTAVPDKYWVCGAPFTAEAVRILSVKAAALAAERSGAP